MEYERKELEVPPSENTLKAHEFLLAFLDKFKIAKRGGIHDFMEISFFNMLNAAIDNIDIYLKSGHQNIDAREIMAIFADSCQGVIDKLKRNIAEMREVNLK